MSPPKNKVAVLIKTCQNRPSLSWVIESIKYALKEEDFRIYISDEKPLDYWKIQFYENLSSRGHHIELHKKGISCGVARNLLLQSLEDEELVLRMDDDFELGGEFNFDALKTVLNASNEIGFCSDFERQLGHSKGVRSGSIRPAGGDIIISPPKIVKKFYGPLKSYRKEKGYRYATAEFTRNLLLLKRQVVEKIKWDEQLLFKGEHLEFMLSIREGGFKGAYTPDSIHYHRDDLSSYRLKANNGSLKEDELNQAMMEKVYYDKWKCKETVTRYPLSWYLLEAGRRLVSKPLI